MGRLAVPILIAQAALPSPDALFMRHLGAGMTIGVPAGAAVLELARLNLIRIHQTAGGEILVYRTTRELAAADREAIGA